ncbi:MAG TPA: Mut7-C RNAse domain-containing protein [archaeon]|nr:Mut7-C RNAse domain-containing protein [archaeon]
MTDEMLGKLTRWLRLCGYDALYAKGKGWGDNEILLEAHDSKRVLLTRDVALAQKSKRIARCVLLGSIYVEGQLGEVVKALGLSPPKAPTPRHCTECNALVKDAGIEEVEKSVPYSVRSPARQFWKCTKCGKVYWVGAHWKRIQGVLESL